MADVNSKWPHLKDINIPEATNCDLSLHTDCMEVILSMEIRCGPRGTYQPWSKMSVYHPPSANDREMLNYLSTTTIESGYKSNFIAELIRLLT